jgi:predicted ATPase with chaperone activity
MPFSADDPPREPKTWEEMGTDAALAEQIALRFLARQNVATGRQVSVELCLSNALCKELLDALRAAKLVQHRGAGAVGDFVYELTDLGRAKALEYRKLNAYVGPLPVPLPQYLAAVEAQSIRRSRPTRATIEAAFADLALGSAVRDRIGPAIVSGSAIFLFGDPGNGKTSLAERITRAFGDTAVIPISLLVDGHIIKLYDPGVHEHLAPSTRTTLSDARPDRRWVHIRRPTVIAGGELTLDMLEFQQNESTGIVEAPLQLKANGGTLVIDDFGRQRVDPAVLLNRWIFPLERRVDYLRLPDGRKIALPFDPMVIFSTNLDPSALVDEAFLRRIPYKIRVEDPTREQFIAVLERQAAARKVALPPGSIAHLISRHFVTRPMRFCHPRDLLQQVIDRCAFAGRPAEATPADWDAAAANYFGAA